MKYIIEILLIAVFVALCYFGYQNNHYTDDKRIDSLQMEIINQKFKLDSISEIEATIIEKKTTINKHYYDTSISIYYLNDSNTTKLLFANIERYMYLIPTSQSY